jgi:hypothetical protein
MYQHVPAARKGCLLRITIHSYEFTMDRVTVAEHGGEYSESAALPATTHAGVGVVLIGWRVGGWHQLSPAHNPRSRLRQQ